jgi:hypothetical protein
MSSIRTRSMSSSKTSQIQLLLFVGCGWLFILDIIALGFNTDHRDGSITILVLLALVIITIFNSFAKPAKRITAITLVTILFSLEIILGWLVSVLGLNSPFVFLAFAAQFLTLLVMLYTAKQLGS